MDNIGDHIDSVSYVPCMHISMHLATQPTACTTGQVHLLVTKILKIE